MLIVDDNRDSADLLAILLDQQGHHALAVYSAEDALTEEPRFKPEVVLLDVGMPRMDGYEVARRLRSAGCAARLVALTGYGRPRDKEHSAAAGFDAHLTKPLDVHALRAELAELGATPRAKDNPE